MFFYDSVLFFCSLSGATFLVSIFSAFWILRRAAQRSTYEQGIAERALEEKLAEKKKEAADVLNRERHELETQSLALQARWNELLKREARIYDVEAQLSASRAELSLEREQIISRNTEIDLLKKNLIEALEERSGMDRESAKNMLIKNLEDEARLAAERLLVKIEEETKIIAKERAATLIVSAMQRAAPHHVQENTLGIVQLPHEEMKGRIIGKEGRNIKALEMATGMEFIIGESPETITIAGFNPIRREIARRSLEKLILDGRINPTRIEETVERVSQEVEDIIEEYGRDTVMRYGLHGMKPEMVSALGKLHFRTSFSQNVLNHSIEVGLFARVIAEELGCIEPEIALRAGILHDIGKALSAEIEGPHALIGADLARRCGENPRVVNAIAAHHEEVPFQSIYAPIVMIADTLSACRPGARRETVSTYIKRLQKLEEIAQAFQGVKRAYAMQAGREIRVIVEETVLSDEAATFLARDLARRIESDMAFPGQIKVNVIRETRTIEYAR
jgi:ribonuclease Y